MKDIKFEYRRPSGDIVIKSVVGNVIGYLRWGTGANAGWFVHLIGRTELENVCIGTLEDDLQVVIQRAREKLIEL